MARTDGIDTPTILIRHAELLGGGLGDVRIERGLVSTIGDLSPMPGDQVIEAGGGLLLPGLHDHHIHIPACAAALSSVACGPPDVRNEAQLGTALSRPGEGWLRGIGYHESVAGLIDRDWLDAIIPERPVRVQHRSGRMWFFNSAGLDHLLAAGLDPPPGLEQKSGRLTGRLYDSDSWLRVALRSALPDFAGIGAELARSGLTGVTDMSPANDDVMAAHFAAQRASGALPQTVLLAGRPDLGEVELGPGLTLGPVKIHLHEEHLPTYYDVVSAIHAAHDRGRGVAVHCVTEVELIFTLAALQEAGCYSADRIEHASVATPAAVEQIAAMGLSVVTQPNFVAERGEAYRAMIAEDQWPDLYRLHSLIDAGIVVAGGTDAPFGNTSPWAAMAAAVSRQTADGHLLGESEGVTPEMALGLFLADPEEMSKQRKIAEGGPADLCLLSVPWQSARQALDRVHVRSTLVGGAIVHDSIDQAPF